METLGQPLIQGDTPSVNPRSVLDRTLDFIKKIQDTEGSVQDPRSILDITCNPVLNEYCPRMKKKIKIGAIKHMHPIVNLKIISGFGTIKSTATMIEFMLPYRIQIFSDCNIIKMQIKPHLQK